MRYDFTTVPGSGQGAKYVQVLVRSLFFVRERRTKKVRVIQDNDSKVLVRFINAKRNKEGKMEYKTVSTLEVGDADAAEVSQFVEKAITGSGNKK